MIYMKVYFILMSIILVYLLCLKHTTNEIKRYDFIEYKDTDDFAILAGSVLLALPVMEMTGTSGVNVNDTGFVLFLWQTDVFEIQFISEYILLYWIVCLEYMEFIGF